SHLHASRRAPEMYEFSISTREASIRRAQAGCPNPGQGPRRNRPAGSQNYGHEVATFAEPSFTVSTDTVATPMSKSRGKSVSDAAHNDAFPFPANYLISSTPK